jgi:hypothetical protein
MHRIGSLQLLKTMDASPHSPHPLDSQFEFLQVSTLRDNSDVVLVTLERPRKRNALHAKVR